MGERVRRPRILAIASGGGHWDQLMMLREAFREGDVRYATTMAGFDRRAGVKAHIVPDCNRDQKWRAFFSAAMVALLVIRVRPDVIVSTGALPGLFALAIGRKLGARTMWIDSIANAEGMSLAGRLARRHSDRWLAQWPGVANHAGAEFKGSVL